MVIGVGRMGSRHAQLVSRLCNQGVDVALASVVDVLSERSRAVAKSVRAEAATDFRKHLHLVDAAIVAVPAWQHFEIAKEALLAGLHVLVEKPLCPTYGQASILCRIARKRGRILQVGHQEWFNPAWRAVMAHARRPKLVEARRTSIVTKQTSDLDVIMDLMIHDLHLIQTLLGEEPSRLMINERARKTSAGDMALVTLWFPNGCTVRLSAERSTNERARYWCITWPASTAKVDFIEQSALVLDSHGARPLEIQRSDVLELQFRAFLEAIRSGGAGPVGGDAILGTMRTAERLSAALGTSHYPAHIEETLLEFHMPGR
jgi:predicted dehydrogenase